MTPAPPPPDAFWLVVAVLYGLGCGGTSVCAMLLVVGVMLRHSEQAYQARKKLRRKRVRELLND